MNLLSFYFAILIGFECLLGFVLAIIVVGAFRLTVDLLRKSYSWPVIAIGAFVTLVVCAVLVGCSSLKPLQLDGKPGVQLAEKGEWSLVTKGRFVGVKKEF